jgi:hypothetical protein
MAHVVEVRLDRINSTGCIVGEAREQIDQKSKRCYPAVPTIAGPSHVINHTRKGIRHGHQPAGTG